MIEVINDLKNNCKINYNAELVTVSREDLEKLLDYTQRIEVLKAVFEHMSNDSVDPLNCEECFVNTSCLQTGAPDDTCIVRALSSCKTLSF